MLLLVILTMMEECLEKVSGASTGPVEATCALPFVTDNEVPETDGTEALAG